MGKASGLFTLFLLSQAPVLVLFGYVYIKDKHDREPLTLLVKTFFAGVVVSFIVVVIELIFWRLPALLPIGRLGHVFFQMLVGVALVEELGKYLALRWSAYRDPAFNEPYDGIMYSVTAALGFAAIENLIYVLQYGRDVALLRMCTAVPMHAVCGVIMGFYVGLAKFSVDPRKARLHLLSGITLAVLTHGSYNYFIKASVPAITPLAFFVLAVQLTLAWKAIHLYRNKNPLSDAQGFYASLPPHDTLVPDKLRWARVALLVSAGALFFWAVKFFSMPAVEHAGSIGAATAGLIFSALGVFFAHTARALRRHMPWAWKASFALFVLMLPTPVFIIGFAGLYGILHPTSRRRFFAR